MDDKEIVKAIEIRLTQLRQAQQIIESSAEKFPLTKPENEARIDELETLLDYIIKRIH